MEKAGKNDVALPYRFCSLRTGCGYVFISLPVSRKSAWENALRNFTLMYKYKRKLDKCLGVLIVKDGTDEYQAYWSFVQEEWAFDQALEDAIAGEEDLYIEGKVAPIDRYRFKE